MSSGCEVLCSATQSCKLRSHQKITSAETAVALSTWPPETCQECKGLELDLTSSEPCTILELVINSLHRRTYSASDLKHALIELCNRWQRLCVFYLICQISPNDETSHIHSSSSEKPHKSAFPTGCSALTCPEEWILCFKQLTIQQLDSMLLTS